MLCSYVLVWLLCELYHKILVWSVRGPLNDRLWIWTNEQKPQQMLGLSCYVRQAANTSLILSPLSLQQSDEWFECLLKI